MVKVKLPKIKLSASRSALQAQSDGKKRKLPGAKPPGGLRLPAFLSLSKLRTWAPKVKGAKVGR